MNELHKREDLGGASDEGHQPETQHENPAATSQNTASNAEAPYSPYVAPGMPQGNPYANPYANPHTAQRYNSFAVGGFVASFFVSIIGIVLSVIGLSEIRKQGGKGRGLAIAGIIIGAVKIIAEIILIIVVIIGAVSWIEQESRNGGFDSYSYEYNFGDLDSSHSGNRDRGTDGRDGFDFDFDLDSGSHGDSKGDSDDLFEYQYQGNNSITVFVQ
ncbi:DUF4190 domain-containing protein [Bifidobacterium cebidarum]|uniref:DUF4190 domain-containing protein n=1 Tax=Bifidobacterium cebidarum TaxID=2650773 RepID=A0A6I1GAN8_9BIFI|nr:DUF4190 domain-containing protein [Bifidobacterium cebidarum]KAB7786984.1 hypothetical protein F7D08_1580 [Bifidobacterium cebidarum]